jgi:hypothetical protein
MNTRIAPGVDFCERFRAELKGTTFEQQKIFSSTYSKNVLAYCWSRDDIDAIILESFFII